jgi:hypothetical protein
VGGIKQARTKGFGLFVSLFPSADRFPHPYFHPTCLKNRKKISF